MPEALFPFSFVLVAVAPDVLSKAVGFVLVPLADEAVALEAFPESVTLFLSFVPLAIVHFPAGPNILALPVDFAVKVLTLIDIVVTEALVTKPLPLIILPLSFVNACSGVSHDAFAISFGVAELSSIYRVFVVLNSKGWLHF